MANVFIITAPSGAGKTSLTQTAVKKMDNIKISVSHTTREKRAKEINAKDYNFISETEFKNKISEKDFLEYAEVFGQYYGTSRAWVEEQLNAGCDVILEIDWQGAQKIRELFPQAASVFILPPSYDILRQRLMARGQDQETTIEYRMEQAHREISHYHEFEYLILNDEFETALSDLMTLIQSQRLKLSIQKTRLASVLNALG